MVMHFVSGLVVIAGAMSFIGLAVLVFAMPAVAERFLMGFASSARTHFAEQILRVLFGGSLVFYSSSMWQSHLFRLIGWAIVVSSVALMLVPWQWHHRFGKRVLPVLTRHMRLY